MPTFPGMADIFERYGVENGNARVGVGGGVHGASGPRGVFYPHIPEVSW
jgi:hypothetical protein